MRSSHPGDGSIPSSPAIAAAARSRSRPRSARSRIAPRSRRWSRALVIGRLALGEAGRADERQCDRVVAQSRQRGGLRGRRAGEEVAGVVEHDRAAVAGPDRPEGRGLVQAGDRHLIRGEAIRTDAEQGERGPAAVDRRPSPVEPPGVGTQVVPEPGCVDGQPGRLLADPTLGDQHGPVGPIAGRPAEVGPLDQRIDVFGLHRDRLARAVVHPARAGLDGQLHHRGGIVLEPLSPGPRAIAVGEGAQPVRLAIRDQPAPGEPQHPDGLARPQPGEDRHPVAGRNGRPPGRSSRGDRGAEEAGVDRRAEPTRRVDPMDRGVRHRQAGAVGELQDAARHRGLAQDRDRGRLRRQLAGQLEPDRLGHVEVRRARPRLQAAQALDVRPRRDVGACQAAQPGAGDPGRIADDQQRTPLAPGQVSPQVEPEQVGAGDRGVRAASVPVRQDLLGRPAMRRLDLDAPNFPRRDGSIQQARQEMPAATRGLEHPRPARADRSQGLEDQGHQLGRGLEITEIPPHGFPLLGRAA